MHRRTWIVLAVAAAFAVPPARAASFVNFESGHVRPLAASPDGTRLVAVNTPDNRLAVFDVTPAGLALAAEVPVGLEPVAVAVRTAPDGSTEAWVVNHLSDSVSVVAIDPADPARAHVARTLLTGDEPRDIVFAGPGGARAFVTAAHRGQNRPGDPELTTPGVPRADVWVYDANAPGDSLTGTPLAILELFGDTPRALAATPDGSTVYAAVFQSGSQTTTIPEPLVAAGGGLPPPPAGAPPDAPSTGLIVKRNPATGAWEDELGRDWSAAVAFDLPDLDVFRIDATQTPPTLQDAIAGVGTTLFNMAVRPTDGLVFVTTLLARNHVRFEGVVGLTNPEQGVRGHIAESHITVIDGGTVTPVHLNPHIDHSVPTGDLAETEASVAFPMDLVFSSDGATVYVAAFGSEAVAVLDAAQVAAGVAAPALVRVGGGPSGLVLDEARDRLYVMQRFQQRIGIVTNVSDPARRALTDSVSLVHDPTPSAILAGRRFLYDARRTSGHGDAACASCHLFADQDGLAWDLGDPTGLPFPNPNPFVGTSQPKGDFHPLKGPMTTQSLRGLADAGPMHWRGDRTGAKLGGDPLDESLGFQTFNVAFPGLLGRATELPDADMLAFTNFILTVVYPPNPVRALDNVPTPSEANGELLFLTRNTDGNTCDVCHSLPLGTAGLSHPDAEPQDFKVPHLRNMYAKVGMFGFAGTGPLPPTGFLGPQVRGFGYLHDGSIDSLTTFLEFFNNLTTSERQDIVRFLLAFDTGLAPAVGQQVTATPATAGDPAVTGRVELLRQQALAGACELIVKANFNGEARGALHVGGDLWRSDRAAEPLVATATVLAVATTPGQEATFTCVPPGTGARMGIDRDLDGVFDRDELDAGTDPADAGSVPGGPAVVPVQTTKLTMKDDAAGPANPARRKLVFKSRTRTDPDESRIVPPAPGGPGDPTLHGATLTVYNAADSGEAVTVLLEPSAWSALGSGGYRYTGDRANGPVTTVKVKPDLLLVKAGKTNWSYTLNEPAQHRMALRLTLGSEVTWCAESPPRLRGAPPSPEGSDHPGRYLGAKKTPPPDRCIAVPVP